MHVFKTVDCNMRTVSVIGATGRQGLAQMKQLLKAGYAVRAMSRSEKPTTLGGMENDVELHFIDVEDQATIAPALEGTDYVFYNHPLQLSEQRVAIMETVGNACKEVGVKHLVWNTATWIPDRPGDPFTYGRNTECINTLWATGVPTTVFGARSPRPYRFVDEHWWSAKTNRTAGCRDFV